MNEQKIKSEIQAPFIIWTFRRTGGTNLGDALFKRSPFDGVQHEPFNADRVFGDVTKTWLETQHEGALREAITRICNRKVLIKHCLETIPPPLNRTLAEVSTQAGYHHLFLYRRRSLDRLLSLHFAKLSGVWGKELVNTATITDDFFLAPLPVNNLVAHEEFCRNEMRAVFNQLCQLGARPLELAFEDLYVSDDVETARRKVKTVLSTLGLSREEAEDDDFLQQVLARGDQGTRDQYKRFTDYDKLAHALEKLGEFELQKEPQFNVTYPGELPSNVSKCIVWDPKVDVQANTIVVSGVVVLTADAPPPCQLLIEHANGSKEVQWGLSSPRLAAQYPGNANATHARFQASGIGLSGDIPGSLILVYPGGRRVLLATMKVDAQ